MNKIFQEHLLDNPVFRLIPILKSISKMFEKELKRDLFLRQVIPNHQNTGKTPGKNFAFCKAFLYIWKNLWYTPVNEFFFSVYHTQLFLFVMVWNAPLLKCLTSVSVNHLLETQNKIKLKTENKIIYFLYIHLCNAHNSSSSLSTLVLQDLHLI